MKSKILLNSSCLLTSLAALTLGRPGLAHGQDADDKVLATAEATAEVAEDPREKQLVIEMVEPGESHVKVSKRALPWIGLATEETSDALAAQLGLNTGEGLLITYVAAESPAAKAGLEKNDVLVEFDDQVLVHPAQFRKLVRMHKEGDKVKLAFFHGGRKQSVSVTVGKTTAGVGWSGDLRDLPRQLRELPVEETVREQMKTLRDSLAQAGIDKESVNVEIKRGMEEVRKAMQEVMRQATNAQRTFGPAAREFQELARRGLDVEKDATVTVKSHRNSVQSIVKTDDSGTYIVVATPQRRLTALDKDGKLLFDGEIENHDQQDKVPREVWEKVRPMLKQIKESKNDGRKVEADEGN